MMFSGFGGVIEIGSGRAPGSPMKTGIIGQPGAAVIGGKVGPASEGVSVLFGAAVVSGVSGTVSVLSSSTGVAQSSPVKPSLQLQVKDKKSSDFKQVPADKFGSDGCAPQFIKNAASAL